MRRVTRGTWTAALVAAMLTAGSTACTGGGSTEGKDAKACSNGTYAWSGVRHTEKLTALAEPISFATKVSSYRAHLEPVKDAVHRPTVTGVPAGADAAAVIKALGTHLKVSEPLAGPSETDRSVEDHYFEAATGDLKGAYYSWAWIGLVDADFTYRCANDVPAKGHVRTWDRAGSGFLSCSSGPADRASGRTAARETCPGGSKATNDA
ncbi:hypothetical protein ACFV29_01920 [Streptomyces sp. NPDC059690]|uniref:hypothetical protein n=1 Tax=Streptomyces sp. NPDC059690 TaxID=3346907 RepID=UPI0036C14673